MGCQLEHLLLLVTVVTNQQITHAHGLHHEHAVYDAAHVMV